MSKLDKKISFFWLIVIASFPVFTYIAYFAEKQLGDHDISTGGFAFLGTSIISYGLLLTMPFLALLKDNKQHLYIRRAFCIALLIPIFTCYLISLRGYYISIWNLINPIYLFPLFFVFLSLVKFTQYKKIYILIFLAFPISFIAFDKISTFYFLATCEAKTPKAEYNPIYLPNEFFHEEVVDGETKLVPNVVEGLEFPYDNILTRENTQFSKDTIYIYRGCSYFEDKNITTIVRSLIKEGYIFLCWESKPGKGNLRPSTSTLRYVTLDNGVKTVAKLYSLGTYTGNKYIKGTSQFCRYNNSDKNQYGNKRMKDRDKNNYIKPLSEKPETQGE